jgi:hypothetical protein
MGNETNVYAVLMLLLGLIYAWPISQVNIHPEITRLSFNTDTQSWLLTLSEELCSGVVISFLIVLVYGFYYFKHQEKCKKNR